MIYIYSCKEHPGHSVETDVPGQHRCENCRQVMEAKEVGLKFKIEDVTISDTASNGRAATDGITDKEKGGMQ